MTDTRKIKLCCKSCQGTDLTFDAVSAWDEVEQTHELVSTQDTAWCNDCNGDETTVVERFMDTGEPVKCGAADLFGDEKWVATHRGQAYGTAYANEDFLARDRWAARVLKDDGTLGKQVRFLAFTYRGVIVTVHDDLNKVGRLAFDLGADLKTAGDTNKSLLFLSAKVQQMTASELETYQECKGEADAKLMQHAKEWRNAVAGGETDIGFADWLKKASV